MFEFKLENTDWYARAWEFFTEHGSFKTPIFMPVWTKASVKWISTDDLNEICAEIILNNTYHLYLRPWDEIIILICLVNRIIWVDNYSNNSFHQGYKNIQHLDPCPYPPPPGSGNQSGKNPNWH